MTLEKLTETMKAKLPFIDKKNEAVSQAAVGWHIQHSLMVINTIITSLEKSDTKEYKWKFNFLRTIILAMGRSNPEQHSKNKRNAFITLKLVQARLIREQLHHANDAYRYDEECHPSVDFCRSCSMQK